MEMGQEPEHRGGAGGVPIHPDARHPAPDPAVAAATSLLFYQLLPGHVPRRGAPHRGRCLLPHPRWAEALGETPGSAFPRPPGASAHLPKLLPRPKSWGGDPPRKTRKLGKEVEQQTVPLGRASSVQN